MKYDLMLFPIGFTLLDSYRISSYESNMCVEKISIGSKSYESKEALGHTSWKNSFATRIQSKILPFPIELK
jgi:hypothetical protein